MLLGFLFLSEKKEMSPPRALKVVSDVVTIPAPGATYPFLTIFLEKPTELGCGWQAYSPLVRL